MKAASPYRKRPLRSRSPTCCKRGGAEGSTSKAKVIEDDEPASDDDDDAGLRAIRRLVRNVGDQYYQVTRELDGMLRLTKPKQALALPDGGLRLQQGIARHRRRAGRLALQFLDVVEMLVRHQVLAILEDGGQLASVEARRRWFAIGFSHTEASGIFGRDGQNIDEERAILARERIDVVGMFNAHLSMFPDFAAHLGM